MKPIKFRGKLSRSAYDIRKYPPQVLKAGTVVCGDLIHFRDGYLIRTEYDYYENKSIEYFADPDSVAQLVGIDSNGKEIYEGDTVLSEDGTEYTVKLVPIAENENEYVRLDTELDNRDFVLKEKTHDKS